MTNFVRSTVLLLALGLPQSEPVGLQMLMPDHGINMLTKGKTFFAKVYDSKDCLDCDDYEADWGKVVEDLEGHEFVVATEVDCIERRDGICEEFSDVMEPIRLQDDATLLMYFYGQADSFSPYDGDRDYDSMSTFIKTNLTTPVCTVFNQAYCSEAENRQIGKLREMSRDGLDAIRVSAEELLLPLDKSLKESSTNLDEETQAVLEGGKLTWDEMERSVDRIVKKYGEIHNKIQEEAEAVDEKYQYKFVRQLLLETELPASEEEKACSKAALLEAELTEQAPAVAAYRYASDSEL